MAKTCECGDKPSCILPDCNRFAADALPETGAGCETRWTAQCRRCDKPATVEMFAESGALLMSVWHNCQCTEGFVLRPVPAPVPIPSGDPLDGKVSELRKLAEAVKAHPDDVRLDLKMHADRSITPAESALFNDWCALAGACTADTILSLLSSLSSLRARVGAADSLIELLVDPDVCRYDHHGFCQTHALDPRPCPHERAIAYLAATSTTEADRAE